ncbi:MAG: metal ABC transporter permease [Planctomycetota bacterium]|nr:metal ABC transporter permease [Planctomycetota bacterium]
MEGLLEGIYSAVSELLKTVLPFEWATGDFTLLPFMVCVVTMPLTGMVGTVVVNARMSFFTSAIAHSAFTGAAVGILMSVNPTWAMVLFGCALALLITFLQRRSEVALDSLVGVAQTLTVALGLVIITAIEYPYINRFLFGDISYATKSDLGLAFLMLLVVTAFMYFCYNNLLMIGLSSSMAKAWGVKVWLYEYLFSVVVAVVVMMNITVIGVLLVAAALIVPAAGGRNFAWSAGSMMWMSVLIALVSGVAGLAISYYVESATGPTIVLVAGAIFMLSGAYRFAMGRLFGGRC